MPLVSYLHIQHFCVLYCNDTLVRNGNGRQTRLSNWKHQVWGSMQFLSLGSVLTEMVAVISRETYRMASITQRISNPNVEGQVGVLVFSNLVKALLILLLQSVAGAGDKYGSGSTGSGSGGTLVGMRPRMQFHLPYLLGSSDLPSCLA